MFTLISTVKQVSVLAALPTGSSFVFRDGGNLPSGCKLGRVYIHCGPNPDGMQEVSDFTRARRIIFPTNRKIEYPVSQVSFFRYEHP